MSRRVGSIQVLSAVSGSVAVGTHNYVNAQSGIVLSLQSFETSAVGGASSVQLRAGDGGTLLYSTNMAANENASTIFGGGCLELPVGTGVFVTIGTSPANLNLYYSIEDERTPITKEAARLASLMPGPATATRTPNMFGEQSQT